MRAAGLCAGLEAVGLLFAAVPGASLLRYGFGCSCYARIRVMRVLQVRR